jgi:ribosomal protein L16 Arg81 hydroxylase
VLNQLEGSLPSLMDLCRSMEARFSHRFQCNIYVTRAESQGLKTHYDTHDVFVLQIAGTKHWAIYDTPIERPFRGQDFTPEAFTPGEKTMEFDLRPGDMVYVPRGVMHDATSTDEDSCHITLGVLPNSWTDLLLEAVARVGLEDAELRRSLPVGYATRGFDRTEARKTFRELLARVVEKADFDGALDHFAEDLVSTRHALLYGQMQQIHRLSDLTVDDRASARPNLMFHLTTDDEHVRVAAYGKTITLPVHAAEPLEHALTNEDYRIGDLPGELDDPGKLVLVRRLVREGLVEIA